MYIALNLTMLQLMFLLLDTTTDHPLKLQAMQSARTSILLNTQNSYKSTWSKWELFYQRYFGCTSLDKHYRNLTYTQFLDQLLTFVRYCVYELKTNIRSIPRIMSALRYSFLTKLVDCSAFDDLFFVDCSAPSCAYFGHDQSHPQYQYYYQRNHAQLWSAVSITCGALHFCGIFFCDVY